MLALIAAHRRDEPAESSFGDLALARFAEQYKTIAPFAALCDVSGRTPATVTDWRDVPLVPVTAFKDASLHTAAAATSPAATFETSGTTDGRPGVVRLADTSVYDAAALATFSRWVLPAGARRLRCIELVPPAAVRGNSSLGHMVRLLSGTFGDGGGCNAVIAGDDHHGRVAIDRLIEALRQAADDGVPVLLMTTTVALGMAMMAWPDGLRIALPAGSRLVDTGGPKGRVQVPARADQHRFVASTWAVDGAHIVGELGMTELGSQRYETTLRARYDAAIEAARVYVGPPWLRSVVLDPATLTPVVDGAIGMVGHVDLANIDTCAFVLTGDLGRLVPVGGAGMGLELVGRAPGAELRGCGLDLG